MVVGDALTTTCVRPRTIPYGPLAARRGAILAKGEEQRSKDMQTLFDERSNQPDASPRPRPWRNDGDYRVKLYKAASRAGHEDVERAAAALAERWAAEDVEAASHAEPSGSPRRR